MTIEEREYLSRQLKRFAGRSPIIVEIGSWVGVSSVAISKGIEKYCLGAKFYCVDIWSNEYYEATPGLREPARKMDVKAVFEKNMKKYPHVTIQMESEAASAYIDDASVDMIFIDANHDYEPVKRDIEIWYKKLKHGGLMCGHDYSVKFPGVIRAVKESFSSHGNPVRTIWEILK